jgi:hypothetical protein
MPANDTIFKRLYAATDMELAKFAAILDEQLVGQPSGNVVSLSKAYRSRAGNSFANVLRDSHALPYKQILIDVADVVCDGPGWTPFGIDDSNSEADIEVFLLEHRARLVRARQDDVQEGDLTVAVKLAEQEILSRARAADVRRKGLLPLLLGSATQAWPTYAITVPATYCIVGIGQRIQTEVGMEF